MANASVVKKNKVSKKIDKMAFIFLIIFYFSTIFFVVCGLFSIGNHEEYVSKRDYSDTLEYYEAVQENEALMTNGITFIIYGVVSLVCGTAFYYIVSGFTEIIELLDKKKKKQNS